jgi:hypothetical protein
MTIEIPEPHPQPVLVAPSGETAQLALAITDVEVMVAAEGVGPPGPPGPPGEAAQTLVQPDPPDPDEVDLDVGDFWIKKPPVATPQPVFTWDGTDWMPIYGEAGTGGFYTHYQMVPAYQWTIMHLLHYEPPVTVENTAGNDVRGSVAYVNEDTVTIDFSEPMTGVAYIGARAIGAEGPPGVLGVYEQPDDPGPVDEGSVWIDTDSIVTPPSGGGGGSGNVSYENVHDHGAVGDGITNDGAAIQRAIDAARTSGKLVYFPSGTYIISQQINLYSGITLIGDGRSSIIKLINGYPQNIDMIATGGTGATTWAVGATEDITIKLLTIDGNKENISTQATWNIDTAPWTTCLHLLDVTNLVLEDLLIRGSTIEGVYLYHVHYGSLNRVEASENGFWRKDASGIHFDTSDHLMATDCVTNRNGFHGIILSAATDNVIANHSAADNGYDGTRLQWSADRNRYEKFISERNFRGLYVMHYSTLNHFTHSTLRNNQTNGFLSNNCAGNDLTFTHIEGNGEAAVASVEAGDNQRGFGNTYRNNVLGDYNLVPGSVFTAISGAGSSI